MECREAEGHVSLEGFVCIGLLSPLVYNSVPLVGRSCTGKQSLAQGEGKTHSKTPVRESKNTFLVENEFTF